MRYSRRGRAVTPQVAVVGIEKGTAGRRHTCAVTKMKDIWKRGGGRKSYVNHKAEKRLTPTRHIHTGLVKARTPTHTHDRFFYCEE